MSGVSVDGFEIASADAGDMLPGGNGDSTQHLWSVQGQLGSGYDQIPFYNLLTDTQKNSSHIVGSPTPSEAGWTAATVARYIADRPAALQLAHFTDANNNSILGAGRLEVVRNTPDGQNAERPTKFAQYRTSQQYNKDVLSVPLDGVALDGYTYIRVITPQDAATAVTYSVTFAMTESMDKRAIVPAAPALRVRE